MRLVLLNLFRKPLRTGLTVFGVAVALLLFCFLETVLRAFNAGVDMADASRLVVQHKESLSFTMPISYRTAIQQIDGVTDCCGMTWFGGPYDEPLPNGEKKTTYFAQLGFELERYLPMYPELKISPEQTKALLGDKAGCALGDKIAERIGKKVGDRIVLRSTIWAVPNNLLTFTVRAIYTSDSPTFDRTMMLFHWEYLNEVRQYGKDTAGVFTVRMADAGQYQRISSAIDARFQNSPYETRSMTERAFNTQFVSMMGNLQLLLRSIGSAVVLTMLLVSANTMMMSARERTQEMAILKSIGFTDGHVAMLLVGESMAICLIGAVVGAGGTYIAVNLFGFNPKPDFFPIFRTPPTAIAWAILIAIATGLLSGIVPAVMGMRLKATEALRSV
ncbi:MAG TPA: FtsX-like permease family protein [Planctomycetota bacterium]|nr:FtsX-like permease family protein [Planctomycetota bacterium]